MSNSKITSNDITVIALANEYCSLIENSLNSEKEQFIDKVIKILPRIYIAVCDIADIEDSDNELYIEPALQEEQYESARLSIAQLLGEDDSYLEVFESDMKYSDTPIGASIAENISDIYQELFNLIATAKESDQEDIPEINQLLKENFANYWSQTLCNLLRAVNNLKFNIDN